MFIKRYRKINSQLTVVAILLSIVALFLPHVLLDKHIDFSIDDLNQASLFEHPTSSPVNSDNIQNGE
jgi:hypothetical protein